MEACLPDNVLEVLGAVDSGVFSELLRAVIAKDTTACMKKLEEMVIQGRELGQFVTDFIWYLRNLLVLKTADDAENMLDMSEDNLKASAGRGRDDKRRNADAFYPYLSELSIRSAMPARNVCSLSWHSSN